MIKRNREDSINREYLYYLMNDYDLYEIGISFDEYDNPDEEILDLIENYRDRKK